MVFALKQAESGTTVEEITRKLGITVATFYRWKEKFGGLMHSEVRKLKQLEEEVRRLKQLVSTPFLCLLESLKCDRQDLI